MAIRIVVAVVTFAVVGFIVVVVDDAVVRLVMRRFKQLKAPGTKWGT